MSILVFGQTGQVARELRRRGNVVTLDRAAADLADPAACAGQIRAYRPDLVINAAAYTAVDRAEKEEGRATVINGEAPGAMARAAAELGVAFLHVSTDYVFDGTGEKPWSELDETGPIGAYGRSKLAGERAVIAAGGAHAILRTSWVYSAHGGNFVKTMLRLGRERETLSVVADQIGAPTAAGDIADALLAMAKAFLAGRGVNGVYHFAGSPDTSWAGFAREIFAQAGLQVTVDDITASAYPTPAKRPANSRLDCSALLRDYGIERPDWRLSLAQVLRDLGQAS